VKPAAFDFVRPRDVGEALKALASMPGEAKPIAGGQSLGPMLNLRLARPGLLVDVARLAELKGIADRGNAWRIGASVTHAEIEDRAGKMPGAEMLCAVAGGIAYRAVRNRGTIGGSLAHADPAADWPLALAALGAEVEINGTGGTRRCAAAALMKGAFATVLAEDEIIVAVHVPKLGRSARWGYYKYCRKTGEFPEASAAALFDPERRVARAYVGALSGAPAAVTALAEAVAAGGGAACMRDAAMAAVVAASPGLEAAEHRMHATALLRALEQAVRT
jgi:aerobic carbon-monoxide dehydrogenase medium subunit